MSRTVAVIGLGLIGGSLAMALKGFEDFTVVGVDLSEPTLRFAAEHGVGDLLTADAAQVLPRADLTILCLHPQGILRFLAEQISPRTYVNLMTQYHPCGEAERYPELCRGVSGAEYRRALASARALGLTRLDQPDLAGLLRQLDP